MQVHPGDPEADLCLATRIETHGYRVLALSRGSHSGTHVDAPFHFLQDGPRRRTSTSRGSSARG